MGLRDKGFRVTGFEFVGVSAYVGYEGLGVYMVLSGKDLQVLAQDSVDLPFTYVRRRGTSFLRKIVPLPP